MKETKTRGKQSSPKTQKRATTRSKVKETKLSEIASNLLKEQELTSVGEYAKKHKVSEKSLRDELRKVKNIEFYTIKMLQKMPVEPDTKETVYVQAH